MSGDHLTIRLSLLGFALGFVAIAMSAAGWNHWALIVSMFGIAAVMFLMALFWPVLAGQVGAVGRFQAHIDRIIGTRFLAVAIPALSFLPAMYFVVHMAIGQPSSRAPTNTSGAAAPTKDATPPRRLRALFEADFPNGLKVREDATLEQAGTRLTITFERVLDFDAGTRYLAFYIPESNISLPVCYYIAARFKEFMDPTTGATKIGRQSSGDPTVMKSTDMKPSGLVYLYVEDDLDLQEKAKLAAFYKSKGLTMQFRSLDYEAVRRK